MNNTEYNAAIEQTLRPKVLSEYVGQKQIKEVLSIYIKAARMREETLDHTLFYGPAGLGKTTLAEIIAHEMGANIRITSGAILEKTGDLIAILTTLNPGDILFIDEIHRLPKLLEEILYTAMEDYAVDVIIDRNNEPRSIRIDLVPFTLIGATTRFGELSSPLRSRFGASFRLDYYSLSEIEQIIKRTASIYHITLESNTAYEIARRSRQTPRIANKLFLRIRDFAEVLNNGVISMTILTKAFQLLAINDDGLDSKDLLYLEKLVKTYHGGPVGLEALAVALSEVSVTIVDVYEPYLLKEGYIQYTPKGRIALPKAYEVLKYPITRGFLDE